MRHDFLLVEWALSPVRELLAYKVRSWGCSILGVVVHRHCSLIDSFSPLEAGPQGESLYIRSKALSSRNNVFESLFVVLVMVN